MTAACWGLMHRASGSSPRWTWPSPWQPHAPRVTPALAPATPGCASASVRGRGHLEIRAFIFTVTQEVGGKSSHRVSRRQVTKRGLGQLPACCAQRVLRWRQSHECLRRAGEAPRRPTCSARAWPGPLVVLAPGMAQPPRSLACLSGPGPCRPRLSCVRVWASPA